MPSPSLPSPVAENHLIWNSPVPRPRYTGVSYNLDAEERCDNNPVWLDVNIGESDDHVEIVNNQPHLSSFPEGVHAWNAPPGNYADFDVVHGEPDNEPGDNEDWFTSQDEMSVDPGGTSYVAPLNVPLLSTAEIPVAYKNLLHHAHDYALHSNDADFSLGWAENNCQSSDNRTRFFDPNAMLSTDSRPSSNSGSDDPLPRPDVNPTNTRPSVTIEEIQEPEIYPNPLPYMGPDGPILHPTTAMGQHPNVEHAQDGCYQQNPNRYFDSDDHADLFHDTNNDSGDGNNHNNYESFNGDDDVQMDQGASGDGIEIDAENDTRPQQFDTANASYIRGLSPLTEIPDTPMPKTYSNEDEVLASLMGELSSLVQNGVKSLSMQSHFKSQMNDPNINIDTLEAILNRCYRYVGALSDNAAPSFAHPEHVSNDQHLSADSEFSPKLYNPPTHRTEGKNYLAELVCNETGVLLGILGVDETRAEPLTPTGKFLATVSPGTIKDFANSRHDGPAVQNFVLQLHHGRRTAWNKAAAKVFCKHFRSQGGFGNYKKKDVYEAFIAHITQLKREFALQGRQKSTREKDDERRARRLARRHKLLHRRIKAFHQIYRYHPGPLGELAKFIRRLTPECMSGDETGMDGKYYKTQVEWRSQELADFLALLSAWYMGGHYLDHGKYSPGELPHPRYPSNRVDMVMQADTASLQLPINWYNPAWLTEYQERRNILSPLPAVSLELPGDIARTLMLLQGLNAQQFTLPDSSEPNILKAQRLNQECCNRRRKTDTYCLKDNGTENRTSAVRSPTFLRGTFWTCVVTLLCRLFGNHRFTLLITLPLVLAYLVQKYFPSARMPKKLIGMSCTTMGVICSSALPDLFAPLRAINCNADYYVSLCGRTEAAPTETVSTYNDALFGPATTNTTTTTTQSEQEFSILQVPVLLDSPSRNFLPLDFGLANNGAKVLPALTSPTEGSSPLSGYDKTQMHMNPPRVVLEEEVLLSNCWKFAGSQGHIAIALSDSII
ncbi:hypothetical protein GG344DRAFT_82535 [Lentinula edodes]|nr:hypothetical protein GG344DRAFT_82535 [Lentinula edodes]